MSNTAETLAAKMFPLEAYGEYYEALKTEFVELVAPALEEARQQAFREAAALASRFSTKPDRELIPGLSWKSMSTAAQNAAHSTAQSIAGEILLLEEPET